MRIVSSALFATTSLVLALAVGGCASEVEETSSIESPLTGTRARVVPLDDTSRAACRAEAERIYCTEGEARAAAAKDLQALPQAEKDAAKAATGQGDVALGMAYSSFGQYDKAVAALSSGLAKGKVRDPDQTEIMLGIANLKLGKKADAVKAFEQVKDDPQLVDLARLWAIVARSGAA